MFVCTPTDLLFEVSFESVSLISRKDLEVGSIGHRADDKVGLYLFILRIIVHLCWFWVVLGPKVQYIRTLSNPPTLNRGRWCSVGQRRSEEKDAR